MALEELLFIGPVTNIEDMSSKQFGWVDYLSVGAQLYQSRQQAAIGNTLDHQTRMMTYQIEMTEKISRGRRALIEYERLIETAREVFKTYPFYAYSIISINASEFEQLGLAGSFFSETSDMRHAIEIQNELNKTLNSFSQELPSGFAATIDNAYAMLSVLQELERTNYESIQATEEAISDIANLREELRVCSNVLEYDVDSIVSGINEAKEEARNESNKARKKILYSALILTLVASFPILFTNAGYIELEYFRSTIESPLEYFAYASIAFLSLLALNLIRVSKIPSELARAEKEITRLEREIKSRQEIRDSAFSNYGVSNIEELRGLPEKLGSVVTIYFPRNPVFPVTSVASTV